MKGTLHKIRGKQWDWEDVVMKNAKLAAATGQRKKGSSFLRVGLSILFLSASVK